MRNVKYLIDDVREATENLDVSEFIGIKDREILRYLNDAQERLQSQIVKKSPKVFVKEELINVEGKEAYSLPSDIFLGNKITDVKYSHGGNNYHWERLEPDYVANRNLSDTGYPFAYIRQAGKIYLKPQPKTGVIRLTYVYSVPALDLKRGSVFFTDIDATTLRLNVLTLDTLNDDLDVTELQRRGYLSIVDNHGQIIEDGIKFDSIDASTGVVTLTGGFHQLKELVSIPIGSIVVSGKKASTHSEFDESVERYVLAYAKMKLMQRDGSQEMLTQVQLVSEMEAEIVESYALISDDVLMIPDINRNWDEF